MTPAAYSMIGDLFPPQRRMLAASVYSGIGNSGAFASFILGSMVIRALGGAAGMSAGFQSWQLVFFAVGIPSDRRRPDIRTDHSSSRSESRLRVQRRRPSPRSSRTCEATQPCTSGCSAVQDCCKRSATHGRPGDRSSRDAPTRFPSIAPVWHSASRACWRRSPELWCSR